MAVSTTLYNTTTKMGIIHVIERRADIAIASANYNLYLSVVVDSMLIPGFPTSDFNCKRGDGAHK